MKSPLILFSLILFHFFLYSQPKINKITWVGINNEYLNFFKNSATLQKGNVFQEFDVIKYVKNNYILLSKLSFGVEIKKKYNIVSLTKDTLILAPDGDDIFSLSEPNKLNHYVFVNSILNYKFVSLYSEEPIDNNVGVLKSASIRIDSARNTKITLKDESTNRIITFKSPIDKKDYERLLRILSSHDISSYQSDNSIIIDKNCRLRVLEIKFNNQIKIFKGCDDAFLVPKGYAELSDFLAEIIALKTDTNIKSYHKKVKK